MSSPSVEPDCIICGGSSCQDQHLSKITVKGKASFKSLISDDTQLVQKFETWVAECAPKNDILYHRSCKLDGLNSSKSVAREGDADIANDREEAKKKRSCSTGQLKLLPYKNKCILCNNPVSLYLNNLSLAKKTSSQPGNKGADDLKKGLLEAAEKRMRLGKHGPFRLREG